MSDIKRADVLAKLNIPTRKAVENAMASAKLRRNPYVEFVHWVEQLALTDNGDLQRICAHFSVDPSRLAKDLTGAIDDFVAAHS